MAIEIIKDRIDQRVIIIMEKGLDLYYGYKLTEQEMINTFFDINFRNYVEDVYSTQLNLKLNFNENNKVERIDYLIRDLVLIYYGKDFFGENGFKSPIKTCCSKCCMYETDSSWIIGIKIAYLPAFQTKITRVSAHTITQNDINELEKLNKQYNLHFKLPSYYNVPSDCWKCAN